jgi:hypothetical protein
MSDKKRSTSTNAPAEAKSGGKQAKKAMESINSHLALVVKSGKYALGYKSTLKALRQVCHV